MLTPTPGRELSLPAVPPRLTRLYSAYVESSPRTGAPTCAADNGCHRPGLLGAPPREDRSQWFRRRAVLPGGSGDNFETSQAGFPAHSPALCDRDWPLLLPVNAECDIELWRRSIPLAGKTGKILDYLLASSTRTLRPVPSTPTLISFVGSPCHAFPSMNSTPELSDNQRTV